MSEEEAHTIFASIRFADSDGAPVCAWCRHTDIYTIHRQIADKPTGEVRRRTIFRCKACLKQFSVTSGTLFASRKLAFVDILYAIALFTNGAKGVSALQMSRDVDVQYKTAFVLLHKIREALSGVQTSQTLEGEVEVDATYVGGFKKPLNRVAERLDRCRLAAQSGKKQSLVIMRERGAGGRSVPFVGSEVEAASAMRKIVSPETIIYADEAVAYNPLHATHVVKRIDHSKEYARGDISTNQAESYWARLKRSQKGVYHRISGQYVGAYHGELSWREDRRRQSNGEQFEQIVAAGLRHPVSRRWKGYWQRRKADAA